jgi:predicted AAA+ superfamily ATPase
MRLSYSKEHKSINQDFEPVDLPDFTVLTGLNGSGKTHLLEAIIPDEHGSSSVELNLSNLENPHIVFYNSKDFNLDSDTDNSQSIDRKAVVQEAFDAWNQLNAKIKQHLKAWRNRIDADAYAVIKSDCIKNNKKFGESLIKQ